MVIPVRARLGELLLEAKLISAEQLTEALRVQVMWGGRLGTVLSELGYLDLDTVSRALGWQHELPAALAKHFDSADHELQRSFDPDLAEWYGCVPLLRVGKRVVVLASMSPLDEKATNALASALGIKPNQLVISIAAELRIRYQHERLYGIFRPHRYLRAPGTERARPTNHGIEIPETAALQPLFDEAKAVPLPKEPGSERRNYVPTLPKERATPPPIPSKRAPTAPPSAFDAALADIRCAKDRAQISTLVLDAVARFVRASHGAALFVVRGKIATAVSHAEPMSIALDAGIVRRVKDKPLRAPAAELMAQDESLLGMLGLDDDDLVIAPVNVEGATVALIALAARARAPIDGLEQITAAVASAFATLMRNVSR